MRTIHRDIVGGFIFSKDGKFLLGKNCKGGVYEGLFVVPGGGVDEGETKDEALWREMKEETGIDIRSSKTTPICLSFGKCKKTLRDTGELVFVKMNFYNYRIDLEQNACDIIVNTDDDWQESQWFEMDKLAKIELSEPTRDTLIKIGVLNPDC